MENVISFPDKLCRVLVIDADPASTAQVRDALAPVSPRLRVYNAPDVPAATKRLADGEWDLVILKPWQARPGNPLPISLIRKAGYNGPVVPMTAGGPAIQRHPKGARKPITQTPKPILQHQNKAAKSAASRYASVPAQISQLLDEAFAGA